MKIRLSHYYIFFILLLSKTVSAQYIQVDDTYTAQELVEALVANSCASVSNISINGSSEGTSYGYFTSGTSNFPFENGIVLTTGLATSATGPNSSLLSEGATDWSGDTDLQQALQVNNTTNATVLEFDFIPLTDVISFDYIFSSEQYLTSITSSAQCNYTDGFAFLLKEIDSDTYQNLAVVPNTDIPVRVNTVRGVGVCPEANEQYFDAFNGTNHPTNYNGQTVILKAEADVIAGNQYHIKLVVADQGNNLYDSAIFLGGGSFTATTDLGLDRLVVNDNPLCEEETYILDATYPTATDYKWYKDEVLIDGATEATYEVTETGTYNVEVQITTDCFSYGEVTIEYSAKPEVLTRSLIQCDDNNDGLTTFNLNLATPLVSDGNNSFTATYHESATDAEEGINSITNTTLYQNNTPNQEIYARVQNPYGCYSVSTVILTTSVNGVTTPTPIARCDEDDNPEDGIFTVNLTQRDDEILEGLPDDLVLGYYLSAEDALEAINPIGNPANFINTTPGGQTLYARIFGGSECYGIAELELVIYSYGDSLANEDIYLCDDGSVILDAGNGYVSYKWDTDPEQETSTITVTETGNYTVTVVNEFGCEGSKTFTVLQSGRATSAIITINDFTDGNNTINITPEGLGDYEYSLNGVIYQDEPIFIELASGQYTIYIRDKNGCMPVYTDTIFVLDYPKFFTPNGDGVNETWRIPHMNNRPDIEVVVFDRFGKIVSGFKGASSGWDGTLLGIKLPATDYWFTITLENGQTIKGHFALLR